MSFLYISTHCDVNNSVVCKRVKDESVLQEVLNDVSNKTCCKIFLQCDDGHYLGMSIASIIDRINSNSNVESLRIRTPSNSADFSIQCLTSISTNRHLKQLWLSIRADSRRKINELLPFLSLIPLVTIELDFDLHKISNLLSIGSMLGNSKTLENVKITIIDRRLLYKFRSKSFWALIDQNNTIINLKIGSTYGTYIDYDEELEKKHNAFWKKTEIHRGNWYERLCRM